VESEAPRVEAEAEALKILALPHHCLPPLLQSPFHPGHKGISTLEQDTLCHFGIRCFTNVTNNNNKDTVASELPGIPLHVLEVQVQE
jgi:hypothetical protein